MLNTAEEVKHIFENEFSAVREKFCVLELNANEVKDSNMEYVWHPGVYVWFHPEKGVLKIGRHLVNSRKRALEHIRDDTGGEMKAYGSDPNTKLLLFNVKDINAYHWVAAVEIFLEKNLGPHIPSKRQG